ncbi:hypothetical protein ACT3TH_11795 [Psychrobacter sp. AOP22-C1-C5]|uniref:hypothetical protein n=1 Tax=Psychrobacter sp. AOP22-C1-C5 TaxID=3457716 RepID=UPI0040363061
MKDYKLLLAGLILLLILFIAIFTWLWINNRKNVDPLPIMANQNDAKMITENDEESTVSDIILYVQVEENLQAALDDVIARFESRYPHIKVAASYVPSRTLLTLPDTASDNSADSVVGIDMIIANDRLPEQRLAPLQAELKSAQDKINQSRASTSNATENSEEPVIDDETGMAKTYYTEAPTLNSYSYALKGERTLEGVILTNNTAAINFRNFLLSSTGQDILEKYDYHNIEGYRNSVDDLFNPTSQSKQASGEAEVDVADALSNGDAR